MEGKREGEKMEGNKRVKQTTNISDRYISIEKQLGVVEDINYNKYTVYKKVMTAKGVSYSIDQSSLRELVLVNSTDRITISLEEVRLLRKNQHSKITLQPHSLKYLKKVILGYRGN